MELYLHISKIECGLFTGYFYNNSPNKLWFQATPKRLISYTLIGYYNFVNTTLYLEDKPLY